MALYSWDELNAFVNSCTRCELCRSPPASGNGQRQSCVPAHVCGRGSGSQEDRAGVPFVGPAGKLLDELLAGCGLRREDIYITNILKCHPPGNRDPLDSEKERCIVYLKYETLLIRPRIIVCLGRVAATRIISPDYRITRQHGQWIFRKNCHLTAVYHPSAILRDPGQAGGYPRRFCRNCRHVPQNLSGTINYTEAFQIERILHMTLTSPTNPKTAVVTGASRGIGLSIARMLAAQGFYVYGLSRHGADSEGISFISCDVTEPLSVKTAFDQISAQSEAIDLLVVNAGMGISGAAEFTCEEKSTASWPSI